MFCDLVSYLMLFVTCLLSCSTCEQRLRHSLFAQGLVRGVRHAQVCPRGI